MEQVVPLMEKVYGLHWRGETVLPSKGVIRWGGVETEWEKGRINALPGQEGHPHWGHQVDRRLPRRRPRAGYAQSGGAGDHQRSRHALPGGDHGRHRRAPSPGANMGVACTHKGGYPDDRHRRRRVPGTDAAHGAARGPPADAGNPHLRCESRSRELRPAPENARAGRLPSAPRSTKPSRARTSS